MHHPSIHLNGTSKQALLDGWEEAYAHLSDALKYLAECAPNGRDYYVQDGPSQNGLALFAAQEEHQKRMQAVRGVMAELQELCEEAAFK
jgi:hypothetical protein